MDVIFFFAPFIINFKHEKKILHHNWNCFLLNLRHLGWNTGVVWRRYLFRNFLEDPEGYESGTFDGRWIRIDLSEIKNRWCTPKIWRISKLGTKRTGISFWKKACQNLVSGYLFSCLWLNFFFRIFYHIIFCLSCCDIHLRVIGFLIAYIVGDDLGPCYNDGISPSKYSWRLLVMHWARWSRSHDLEIQQDSYHHDIFCIHCEHFTITKHPFNFFKGKQARRHDVNIERITTIGSELQSKKFENECAWKRSKKATIFLIISICIEQKSFFLCAKNHLDLSLPKVDAIQHGNKNYDVSTESLIPMLVQQVELNQMYFWIIEYLAIRYMYLFPVHHRQNPGAVAKAIFKLKTSQKINLNFLEIIEAKKR